MKTRVKASIIIIFIICIILVFMASGIFILYYGENYQHLKIVQDAQDEYSVPVKIRVINESGNYIAYMIPEKVRWDKEYKRLLYNLSNSKEIVLAYVEALSNYDGEALDILMSQETRGYWESIGYSPSQILEVYRSHYKGSEKPFRFEIGEGDSGPPARNLKVSIKGEADSDEFGLKLQPDGTWRI